MTIKMLGYGAFVDQGVQGANPSGQPMGAKHRVNQAPKSPYKFGSGKGGTGLRAGINKWVTQKNLKGVRDKQGRFIPRKSLQFLIVRSIWNTGLKPTLFLTNAFNKRLKKTEDKIIEAFFKDYAKDLEIDKRQSDRLLSSVRHMTMLDYMKFLANQLYVMK